MLQILFDPAAARAEAPPAELGGANGADACGAGAGASAADAHAACTAAGPPGAAAARGPLADVRGQQLAKRALAAAAAGGHALLFVGPPGAGKSMLAARLPRLLAAPSLEERLEITRSSPSPGAGRADSRRRARSARRTTRSATRA